MTIKEKYDLWRKMNVRKLGMNLLTQDSISQRFILLQQEQMLHGEDNQGNMIGKYKSDAYASMKERMNSLAGGTVDLKLSGSFYNAITLVSSSNSKYRVYSKDKKNKILTEWYGDKIFYLNPIYLAEFRKFFMPYLVQDIIIATSK